MANTGSGSLATILFFFIFPAALRKGRTLAGVRLSLRLPRFLLASSPCQPLLLLFFAPTGGVRAASLLFPKEQEKKKGKPSALACVAVRDDAQSDKVVECLFLFAMMLQLRVCAPRGAARRAIGTKSPQLPTLERGQLCPCGLRGAVKASRRG